MVIVFIVVIHLQLIKIKKDIQLKIISAEKNAEKMNLLKMKISALKNVMILTLYCLCQPEKENVFLFVLMIKNIFMKIKKFVWLNVMKAIK